LDCISPLSSFEVNQTMKNSSPKIIDKKQSEDYINTFLSIIGENIKNHRQLKGMSQDDLIEKSNLSRTTLSRIENGLNIELDNLIKIANALEIHPADLFKSEYKKDILDITKEYSDSLKRFSELLDELSKKIK